MDGDAWTRSIQVHYSRIKVHFGWCIQCGADSVLVDRICVHCFSDNIIEEEPLDIFVDEVNVLVGTHESG